MLSLLDEHLVLSPSSHIIKLKNNKTKIINDKYEVIIGLDFSSEDMKKLANNTGISHCDMISKAKTEGYTEEEALSFIKHLVKLDILSVLSPFQYILDFHKRTSFEYITPGVKESKSQLQDENAEKKYDFKLSHPSNLDETLQTSLCNRKSYRIFQKKALSENQISTLLWSMYGGRQDHKVVASAGGVYPLKIFIFSLNIEDLDKGVYEYLPSSHSLKFVKKEMDISSLLVTNHINYENSGSFIVICGNVKDMCIRYADRGYRYLLIEAGLVGQNAELATSSLNLSSILLGGFKDKETSDFLGLDDTTITILGMVIGNNV
jgi:SagB-type dehydrogenase family enzyme